METLNPVEESNRDAVENREKIRKEREFELEQKGLEKEIEEKKIQLQKKELLKNWLIVLIIVLGLAIFAYFLL